MTNALNYVKIKTGTYRKNEIVDTVFPILKPLNVGKKGAFITVNGTEVMGDKFEGNYIFVSERTEFNIVATDR
mgnify:CR=1 FL=1